MSEKCIRKQSYHIIQSSGLRQCPMDQPLIDFSILQVD